VARRGPSWIGITRRDARECILRPVHARIPGESYQVPTISILLLAAATEAAGPAALALGTAGHDVTVLTDPDEAIRLAAEFGLIVIDAVEPPRTALEICAEIRRTPALAAIPVLCISQHDDVEERVQFLEAGADDVIARPFDPRELDARVEGLLIRFRRSRDLAPLPGDGLPTPTRRNLIACFSPKGGAGTTTIAVNVAAALAERVPNGVAILDLDVDFGQVATHLNVKPRLTVADLAGDEGAMREPELLRTYGEKSHVGVSVIAAPANPELGRLISPEHVEQILVVDMGSRLDERSLAVLDRAEAIVVPIVPEIGALKAFHGFLEFVTEEGAVPSKSTFVLNHLFARDMLTMRQIESAIAARVDSELPYDPGLYLKAVNEGVPIVRGAPTSAPAKALTALATHVAGLDDDAATEARNAKRGLLGGLRRRG
jgi:pilus assembly protein CpaE